MPNRPAKTEPQPRSLEGHTVPEERLALIKAHMAVLSAVALEISDTLPLQADAGDFVATLEREGE